MHHRRPSGTPQESETDVLIFFKKINDKSKVLKGPIIPILDDIIKTMHRRGVKLFN